MVVGERNFIDAKDDSRPVCDECEGGGGGGTVGRGFSAGICGWEVIVRRFCVSIWDVKVSRSTRRPETNDLTFLEREELSSLSSL